MSHLNFAQKKEKKKKKKEGESKKLERNEETKAPNERKQQIRFAGAKISPQGLEPWSTGSINTMHSLNLIRRSASASVWLLM